MARTRSLLRAGTLQFQAISGRTPLPSDIASLVNEELCKNNAYSKFVTLFLGFLDLESGKLTFCNAGHVYPILAGSEGVKEIISAPDPALGVIDGLDFSDHALTIAVGDTFILTSDGLSDTLNGALESFGTERVLSEIDKVAGKTTAVVVNAVVSAARAFANGAAQFDDITVLAIRRLR